MTPLMRSRRGFITLLEFLLLAAMAAVLLLILLPACARPRRLSTTCRNNLRQVGVGLLLFHDQQAVFPSSGGYAGDPIYLVQYDIRDGPDAGQRIGIGYPDRVPEEQTGSWVYAIRPCLDRRANADAGPSGGRDIALPMLLCPARGRPALQPVPTRDPIYAGMAYQSVPEDGGSWGKSDYSCNGLAIPPRGSRLLRMAHLGDGLSSTILVGEKALDPQAYQTGGWYEDGPVFAGGLGISRTGTLVVCDEIDPARSPTGAFVNNWGSAHPGGAHFLFADGSVRLRPHGSGGQDLLRLLTPNRGATNEVHGDIP